MKYFIKSIIFYSIIIFIISNDVYGQKNYILPDPQDITFPESDKDGFRLSKKTSLTIIGSELSKFYVKDLLKFISKETEFELSTSKQNKKSKVTEKPCISITLDFFKSFFSCCFCFFFFSWFSGPPPWRLAPLCGVLELMPRIR